MDFSSLESLVLIVVFVTFGLEILVRLISWCFNRWREYQDIKDWYEDAEDDPKP